MIRRTAAVIRRTAAVLAAAAVLVLAGGALATAAQPTSAAWTDGVYVSSAASSGTWSAGLGTCSVEKLAGYTGVWNNPACTVTGLRADTPWGSTGNRQTYVYATLAFTGSVEGGQEAHFRVVVGLNLGETANLPADWKWSTTGVGVGNLLGKASDYQCSSLTQPDAPFGAYVHGNYYKSGQSVTVGFPIYENHGTMTGLVCP